MKGRFISLEGGEGVGKSTQLKALAEALRGRGLEVVETREPGGSPGAEAIRNLLLEGGDERWTAEAEALLFAAAPEGRVTARGRGATSATSSSPPSWTWASATFSPALNKGWAFQARKPQSMNLTDSSIRWLKLDRPATTMTIRRPFCSADPVKP